MGSADTLNSFTNSGTITMGFIDDYGIMMSSGDGTFVNSGTITVRAADDGAINMGWDGDESFTNSGIIDIGTTGWHSIAMNSGDDAFVNSGTINIENSDRAGITLGSGADSFENSGTIDIGYANYHGISTGSDDDTFANSGTIDIGYANNQGITLCEGDDTFNNSGMITIDAANQHGINMGDGSDSFTNSGTIDIGYAYCTGIKMGYGDEGEETFTNSGTITIGNVGNHGIDFGSGDGDEAFDNSGTITINSTTSNGINMRAGDDTFTNSGTITIGYATNNGIAMSYGDDSFINTGTINIASAPNAVNMEDGDDTFTSSGALNFTGDVDGGSDYDGLDIDTLTLEGDQVLSFDGNFLNFEEFAKDGTGTWALNGDVEVENTATVAAGTLLINGTMGHHTTGPLAVTVDTTGTLGGDGTITGNVTNSGTLAPGNSVGTLTIDGDYTHESGAVFSVEVDSFRADQLDVTGMVTANGGIVDVTPVGLVRDGYTYDIITSGSGLDGDGLDSDVVSVSPVLTFLVGTASEMGPGIIQPVEGPDTVQLTVARTSYADALDDGTANQVSMAGTLQDMLDHPGAMEGELLLLDTCPDKDALGKAIDGLSPEHYAALSGAGIAGANLFRDVLMDRLGSFHGTGVVSRESDSLYASTALTNVPAAGDADGWSIWARGFGGSADQNQVDDKFGYSYDTYGVALGVDRSLSSNLVLGIGAGYEATDLDHDTIDAETDISTVLTSIYGTYTDGRYYVDASLFYAWNDFDSERYVPLVDMLATSEHDGSYYSASIEAGYNMSLGEWMFVPAASLTYGHFEEDSFTESGAGGANLTVADSDVDSLVSKVGFSLGRMMQMGDMKVLPEMSLEWACELKDNDREVAARFAGVPAGESFTVEGVDPERNSALVGFGLTMYVSDCVTTYINYDLELRDDFDAQAVSGGLRFRF